MKSFSSQPYSMLTHTYKHNRAKVENKKKMIFTISMTFY